MKFYAFLGITVLCSSALFGMQRPVPENIKQDYQRLHQQFLTAVTDTQYDAIQERVNQMNKEHPGLAMERVMGGMRPSDLLKEYYDRLQKVVQAKNEQELSAAQTALQRLSERHSDQLSRITRSEVKPSAEIQRFMKQMQRPA